MKKSVFLSMLILLCSSLIAQQARTINEPYFGVRFTVPEGWQYQRSEIGYVMGHNSIPGLILLMSNDFKSISELENSAMQGIQDDQGTYLMPSGGVIPFGNNGRAGNFSGTLEGQQVSAYLISLISTSNGNGVTMMAAAIPDQFDESQIFALESLAKSVQFNMKETPSVVKEWMDYLKVPGGSRLTYMSTYSSSDYGGGYSGSSEKITIDLCPEGYFIYAGNSSMSFDTGGGFGYGNSDNQGNGSWKLETDGTNAVLVLNYNNGQVSEYTITYENEETQLNGSRYFVTFTDSGESGPACN